MGDLKFVYVGEPRVGDAIPLDWFSWQLDFAVREGFKEAEEMLRQIIMWWEQTRDEWWKERNTDAGSGRMNVYLDEGARMPTRAHDTDAGLDLYAMNAGWVKAGQSMTFDTGVHIELPAGHVGFIRSKSGLMCNHDITSDGTIDEGYTGAIMVHLFNHGAEDYNVCRGDKISQLVILPCAYVKCEYTGRIKGGARGDSGFGSTGR